ncbi:hypothetical protein [Novosphingobium sp. EMRT-2]|uniref:hypothetical protein n=1 Tax=Novosphingobium sp. EMRT-2 TaxID=2571749 RepID=UPI0010BD2F11|nr:hypothetical protein [Novosphingobium sp. EMRT-2]QCI93389.1 hypothetical protein FA702_07355 [Novosphingobium sp. EMRT-2]
MSLVRSGGGRGCFAKWQTLADDIGVDIARFSKSLKRLREFGYVVIEQQDDDRRRKTIRVVYPENSCTERQVSNAEMVATSDNNLSEMVDMGDNQSGEIVDIRDFETRRNLPKTTPYYIPLKGELHVAEARGLYAVETARRFGACDDDDDFSDEIANAVQQVGKRASKAELPTSGIRLNDILPGAWKSKSIGACLAGLERGLQLIGYRTDRLIPEDAESVQRFLSSLANVSAGEQDGYRAERMLERIEQAEAAA